MINWNIVIDSIYKNIYYSISAMISILIIIRLMYSNKIKELDELEKRLMSKE